MSFEVGYRSGLDTAFVQVAAVAHFKTHVLMYSELVTQKNKKKYQLPDNQIV
jgi:hypothetical protein